jgi:hypothetical protein
MADELVEKLTVGQKAEETEFYRPQKHQNHFAGRVVIISEILA